MSNSEEKSKQRLIVLKTLYEITDGNEDDYVLLEILQSNYKVNVVILTPIHFIMQLDT